jgi:osmotically-inducible protein OsmY
MVPNPVVLRVILIATLMQCGAALPAVSADLKPQDASTPTQASSDTQDLEVTAQIRHELQADSSFSVLAKNVRVSTNSDAVVLRGVVRSGELDQIEALAQKYSGSRQVINQLTVDDLISAANP